MRLIQTRALAASALMLVGGGALAGCAAGIDTDDSGSRAVVEKFLNHLEAGEATAAAALTEMELADEGNELDLLPTVYNLEYTDPTGLLRLGVEDDKSFTVTSPNDGGGFSIVPGFMPDVEPAITAEIERLQNATAPGEWFRDSGLDIRMQGDGYESTSTYTFVNDRLPDTLTVSYSGIVTRDASGAVLFTR